MRQDRHDDDDEFSERKLLRRRFFEFECPTCTANNPADAFGHGDEVLCHYCGLSFLVKVNGEGKLSLREI